MASFSSRQESQDADTTDHHEVDLVKDANLMTPKQCSSLAWKFFGFKHEDGVVKDHTYVSLPARCAFSILYIRILYNYYTFIYLYNFIIIYKLTRNL